MTEEEKKARKQEYNKRYRSTENGKKKTREHNLKYQQSEKYKQYKKEYMKNEYIKKKEE